MSKPGSSSCYNLCKAADGSVVCRRHARGPRSWTNATPESSSLNQRACDAYTCLLEPAATRAALSVPRLGTLIEMIVVSHQIVGRMFIPVRPQFPKIYDKGVYVTNSQNVYDLLVSYRSGDMWAPKVAQTEALKVEAEYFVDCVLHNKKPLNDGEAGRQVVQLLEAANRSLKKRGEIVYL